MTETSSQAAERLCELAVRAGRREVCPEDECPLWENGACTLGEVLEEADAAALDKVDDL